MDKLLSLKDIFHMLLYYYILLYTFIFIFKYNINSSEVYYIAKKYYYIIVHQSDSQNWLIKHCNFIVYWEKK